MRGNDGRKRLKPLVFGHNNLPAVLYRAKIAD